MAQGCGGWLPWYMFYIGSPKAYNTGINRGQLALMDVRLDPSKGLHRPDVFAHVMAPHGAEMAVPLLNDVYDAGDHLRFVRSFKDVDGWTPRQPQAVEVTGGVKQSVTLQNYYMGFGDDPEGLQSSARIPLVAADLDPDIFVDPVPGPLNFPAVVDIYVEPELRNGGIDLTEDFMRTFRDRLTVADRDGSRDAFRSRSQSFAINPYADVLRGSNNPDQSFISTPFITSSDLDYDPARPKLRFVGYQFGPRNNYMLSDVDSSLLKLRLTADPMHEPFLNPNCVMLSLHTPRTWHMPVAAVLQGGLLPTTSVSPVYTTTWNRPSFNVLGFSTNTDPIVASAGARPRLKYRNVITIDRPGTAATGTYRVERYSHHVIEHMLTSHLPYIDAEGNKAKYFTDDATALHDGEINTQQGEGAWGCLQPVAFPAGQMPEDPWLWFVSMDDDYRFWLNKQEIGKANTADCLSKLPSSPIQLVVSATSVFLLYGSELRVFNIADSTWTILRAGTELPDTVMHAIAIDREQSRTWIGHADGVFELLGSTFSAVDLSALPGAARRVAKQGLVAVNGYLAWNNHDYIQAAYEYEILIANYAVRVTVATGAAYAWSYADVSSDGQFSMNNMVAWQKIGKVGLRSNGDMLITHTESWASNYNLQLGLSWFKVRPDGTLFRKHFCQKFCGTFAVREWGAQYGDASALSTTHVFMPPVHRIDDFHYVTGAIPFRYPMSSDSYMTAPEKNLFVCDSSPGGPYLSSAGPSQILEFRLDEETNWLYLHPKAYARELGGYAACGQDQFSDLVNFPNQQDRLLPGFSLLTRGGDFEFALYSMCVVVIDKCYATLMAGAQHHLPMGIELDWNGFDWVHRVAGHAPRARALHTSQQPVSPHVSVAFDPSNTNFVFQKTNCYRVDVQPSTSATLPSASLYLGDYNVLTETVVVAANATATVSAAALDTFCGVDVENTKDIAASAGGSALVLVSGTPAAGQFSISKDGVCTFHTSLALASVQVTYNAITQAV